jgi:cysteinyl-tRNA synthetase
MVALIQRLIDADHAYPSGGDVYFDVRSHAAYGELSGQQPDALQSGEEATATKRSPLDFALWKSAKPGEPFWDTPWGPGRPGWHIECSAMATKYLGPTFDIHGGGLDLVFPHHENELAQSSAAGDGFARFWLHHGLLNTSGTKMSKSLGNSLFVADLLDAARPQALRYYLVSPHYRSESEWSDAGLAEADAAYSRIENFLTRAAERFPGVAGDTAVPAAFATAMDDDISVPSALGVLHDTVRRGNSALADGDETTARAAYGEVAAMTEVLGLSPADFADGGEAPLNHVVEALMPALLESRQAARERKDFAESDRIRDALSVAGIVVEDTADGPRWRLGSEGR